MIDLTERLTSTQVARQAGVSEALVRQWADKGLLSCIVTPLGRLFDLDDVERFVGERRQRRTLAATSAGQQ